MSRISVKAIAVGNLAHVFLWLFATIVLLTWTDLHVRTPEMSRSQVSAAVALYIQRNGFQIVRLSIGFLVALSAGFIAGKLAERNEALHGLLSSVVGFCLGLVILMKTNHAGRLGLLELILVSVIAAVGGQIAKQASTNQAKGI